MLPRKLPLSFLSAAAVVAAMTLAMPSGASAGTVTRHAAHHVRHSASATTDISASRRRHTAHHRSTAARAAYGSVIDGPVYGYPAPAYQGGYPGYGYGIGDNSNSYAQ
jgi:hypothetical protein